MSALKVLDIRDVVVVLTSGRRPELVASSGSLPKSGDSLVALLFLGGGGGGDSSSELELVESETQDDSRLIPVALAVA